MVRVGKAVKIFTPPPFPGYLPGSATDTAQGWRSGSLPVTCIRGDDRTTDSVQFLGATGRGRFSYERETERDPPASFGSRAVAPDFPRRISSRESEV